MLPVAWRIEVGAVKACESSRACSRMHVRVFWSGFFSLYIYLFFGRWSYLWSCKMYTILVCKLFRFVRFQTHYIQWNGSLETNSIHLYTRTATSTPNSQSSKYIKHRAIEPLIQHYFSYGQMTKSFGGNFIKEVFILISYVCNSNYANRIRVFFPIWWIQRWFSSYFKHSDMRKKEKREKAKQWVEKIYVICRDTFELQNRFWFLCLLGMFHNL